MTIFEQLYNTYIANTIQDRTVVKRSTLNIFLDFSKQTVKQLLSFLSV